MEAVLRDFRSAPISDRLRAMLGYLEKMTLRPEEVGAPDLEPLRRCDISDEAIADAVHVCAAFQIYDRLADAMGWHVPATPSFWSKQASYLLRSGYEGGRKPRSA